MTEEKKEKGLYSIDHEFQWIQVSLVSCCPRCHGSFDKPVKMPSGEVCNHPTKLRFVKPEERKKEDV